MDIFVERTALQSALKNVIGTVGKRPSLPILSNFRIEAVDGLLTITGTDLESECAASCAADVQVGGIETVDAAKLTQICGKLPDVPIRIKSDDDDKIIITAGKSRFTLASLPASEFPLFNDESLTRTDIIIPESLLKMAIDKVSFAMGQQDVRYYLNGALFHFTVNKLTAVATDGHRMAKFETEIEYSGDEKQFIVPAKTVNELRRLLTTATDSLNLSFSERSVQTEIRGVTIKSKLIDGKFPEYERVIPKSTDNSAVCTSHELKSAIDRVTLIIKDKHKGVSLLFSTNNLRLTSREQCGEEGVEEIGVSYSGEECTIGFNAGSEFDHQNTFDLVPLALHDALQRIMYELSVNDSERLQQAAFILACSIARLTPNLN